MFTTAFYNIDRQHNLLIDKNLLDSNHESTKLQFLLDIRTLVESQLTNPYLLDDKDLQLTWISFQTSIKNYEDILREGDVSFQMTDGKNPVRSMNAEEIEKYKKQWFKIFNNKYLDFYFPTLEKLTKDNEMPYQKKKK